MHALEGRDSAIAEIASALATVRAFLIKKSMILEEPD